MHGCWVALFLVAPAGAGRRAGTDQVYWSTIPRYPTRALNHIPLLMLSLMLLFWQEALLHSTPFNSTDQPKYKISTLIQFAHQSLTSYAGLELFSRYLRVLCFNELLQSAFVQHGFSGDYKLSSLVRLLLAHLLVGARR